VEIDPENLPAHKLIVKNGVVRECVDEIKDELPKGIDLDTLSIFLLPF
jgi:hypothetical protein